MASMALVIAGDWYIQNLHIINVYTIAIVFYIFNLNIKIADDYSANKQCYLLQ